MLSGGGVKSHLFDSPSPSYSDLEYSCSNAWFRLGQDADSNSLRRVCRAGVAEIELNRRTIGRCTEIQIDSRWGIAAPRGARETDFNLRTVHIQIDCGAIRSSEVDDDFRRSTSVACAGCRAGGR